MSKELIMAGLLLLCTVFLPAQAKETPACATDEWGICKDTAPEPSYKACAFRTMAIKGGIDLEFEVTVVQVPDSARIFDCVEVGVKLGNVTNFSPVCLYTQSVTEASVAAEDAVEKTLRLFEQTRKQMTTLIWWPISRNFDELSATPTVNCGW